MLGIAGALALAAVLPGPGSAQHKAAPKAAALLDIAVFAELPALETPEVSPNGKLLAAKVAIGGKQYFAIKPLDGGSPRLIPMGEAELNWWHWVNDDYLVMGIGQRQKLFEGKDAPERHVRRAVSVRASDGKMTKIGLQLIDNADNVIWVARDGSPRVLMLSQRTIYYNEAGFWPDVDEIDVATGQRRNLVRGRSGVLSWHADAKGVVRMGIGYSEDGRNKRLLYRRTSTAIFASSIARAPISRICVTRRCSCRTTRA